MICSDARSTIGNGSECKACHIQSDATLYLLFSYGFNGANDKNTPTAAETAAAATPMSIKQFYPRSIHKLITNTGLYTSEHV